jgi:hypothetical protein
MQPARVLGVILLAAAACGDDAGAPSARSLTLAAQTAELVGCMYASPTLVPRGDDPADAWVVVATTAGEVVAYDASGAEVWSTTLPAAAGRRAWIAATPALVDDTLVVAWQDAAADSGARASHHVAVLDVASGALDDAFPILTLTATRPSADGGDVVFNAATAFSRSALVHAPPASGGGRGTVYVSFGNIQDIQPWHGWIFALDLDAWRASGAGAAIANVLLTTAEDDCGPAGQSGSDDMICGGGIWTPTGPTLIERDGARELWVPTGNGQLDLGRGDYANTIMRVGLDLGFDPSCSAACDAFDPIAPSEACLASCEDLFIPRLAAGDPPLAPPGERCAGLSFLECYAALDLDLGADAPALVTSPAGRAAVVLPAKDGAVYLFDADHFGAMWQRVPLRDFCGAGQDDCRANWAGTMVTRPLVAALEGAPIVVVATFVFDDHGPAGLVAFDVVDDGASGEVRLRERWRGPTGAAERERFREHTGQPILVDDPALGAAEPLVVIADPAEDGTPLGELFALRLRDGAVVARAPMAGRGRKYVAPAVLGDRLVVPSCDGGTDAGPSHLEFWELGPR